MITPSPFCKQLGKKREHEIRGNPDLDDIGRVVIPNTIVETGFAFSHE
jgi:hypothetical protein